MKRKIIICLIVFALAMLLIPIPTKMKDGGTIHYNAILYDIYDFHRVTTPLEWNDAIVENEYIEGTVINILGFEVYNSTNPRIELKKK